MTSRALAGEYPPHYQRYVDLVPEDDAVVALEADLDRAVATLRAVSGDRLDTAYAAGKWTIREVGGHILDSERIYGYRLLTFARGDVAPLLRADQDLYVHTGEFGRYAWEDLLDELVLVRRSHVGLARHLPPEAWERRGVVSGSSITVRGVAFVMAGHLRHHVNSILRLYG